MTNSSQMRYKELGDFLKTRRAKILSSQVGLESGSRRRTPGLRREEVAQLAGVGLTWYVWLEQGRPIQASASVIESLSKVLLLDRQERAHLYHLANQPLPVDIPKCQRSISATLQRILDQLEHCPSLITDQRWNVVAWNKAACFIFGDFNGMNARDRNIVWTMFTNEKYRDLLVDWDLHAKSLISRFRATCGQYVDDLWLAQFVEELKGKSPEFKSWWPLHEIKGNGELYKRFRHPEAGILDFEISNFEVADDSGLKLVVHMPLDGTDTRQKMLLTYK